MRLDVPLNSADSKNSSIDQDEDCEESPSYESIILHSLPRAEVRDDPLNRGIDLGRLESHRESQAEIFLASDFDKKMRLEMSRLLN